MWTSEHARALRTVIELLNESGIPWLILRNYKGLPQRNRAKDIDIAVRKEDFSSVSRIITEAMVRHNFHSVSCKKFQYAWCFTFYELQDDSPCIMKVDIMEPFLWRGASIITFDELYAHKVPYGKFYVPTPVYDAFMLWLKPLMTGGMIKVDYKSDILTAAKKYPVEIYSLMQRKLGQKLTLQIRRLFERSDVEGSLQFQSDIRLRSWLICCYRYPLTTMRSLLEHLYIEVKHRCFSGKRMIVLIGADGTGKSTIIEHLKNRAGNLLKWDTARIKILHFRPGILPNLSKLVFWRKGRLAADDSANPHCAKPSNAFVSFIRLLYYTFDYVFGYYVRLRWLFGRHYIILFDRYYYDFIVDPARSRIKLPKIVPMFVMRLIPRPTLTVLIDNDVETILDRKQELPASEIVRQLGEYRTLIKSLPNAISVDGRNSVVDTVDEIVIEYIRNIAMPIKA